MNTSVPGSQKPSLHPLMIAAALAVLLFCALGSAALMGWLPSSIGANNKSRQDQQAGAQLMITPQPETVVATTPLQMAAAEPEPVRHTAPPAVCSSCGVVEAVHSVNHRAQGSGVGAAGGAVVGGLLGNQVGSGHGRQLATIAGAIGGAVAGNQIEGNVKSTVTYNIVVRLDNGKTRTFHQSTQPGWNSGDRVRIVNGALRHAA